MNEVRGTNATVAAESGFTLLEVLIGIIIATIGLLALAMMQGTSVTGNALANRMTRAVFVGQMKMEELGTLSIKPVSSGATDLSAGGTFNDTVDENGAPGGPFARTWTVEPNTEYSRRITVTVSWADPAVQFNDKDGNPVDHSVTFSSITRGDQD